MKKKIRLNVMGKGDSVLFVNQNFIAVKRKSGEVDLLSLVMDGNGMLRVDAGNVVTIGYGSNEVKADVKGKDGGEIHITTF